MSAFVSSNTKNTRYDLIIITSIWRIWNTSLYEENLPLPKKLTLITDIRTLSLASYTLFHGKWKCSHSVVSYSLQPHGLEPDRLLCPWNSPDKNPGVGCHFLLQGIFSTEGWNMDGKESATMRETWVWSLGWIPWTEEPGRLQSMGLQRVGHDLANKCNGWQKKSYCSIEAL